MFLNSFSFFIFFASVFIFYWKIPVRFRWIVLLGASYLFYASWNPAYIFLIIGTTLVNYFGAKAIYRSVKHRTQYLLITLVLNIGALLILKYINFYTLTFTYIGSFLDWEIELPQFQWILPLGISFYTLQMVGYLMDVYHHKIKPETHLGLFALFISFFPQIPAGPIARSTSLLPQLKKPHWFEYTQVVSGMKLFTYGLFKKMVIADNLGIVVDRVFSALPEYKGFSLIVVIFFYTWQIYTDFSGYTDMARGVARMLGIELMENFNLPYLATSVRDFWRRWHISLSTWFRDYIYIPLGGNRGAFIKVLFTTLIVFAVSGMWHGAAWHFVVWGLLHGVWVAGERFVKTHLRRKIHVPEIVRIIYTYTIVSIFWIFFRAESLADAWYVLRNSFVGVRNFISPSYIGASLSHLFEFNTFEILLTFGLCFVAIIIELIRRRTSLSHFVAKQPVFLRFAFYSLLIFLIIQFRNADIKQFIYTRF